MGTRSCAGCPDSIESERSLGCEHTSEQGRGRKERTKLTSCSPLPPSAPSPPTSLSSTTAPPPPPLRNLIPLKRVRAGSRLTPSRLCNQNKVSRRKEEKMKRSRAHLFCDLASFVSLHLDLIVYESSVSAEIEGPASFVCHEVMRVVGMREEGGEGRGRGTGREAESRC